jgi:caffeyl-CoA reductase-Etf complex subunit CarE
MSPSGILVLAEVKEGKITSVTCELLTTGTRLGNKISQPVSVLLAAENLPGLAAGLITLGADKIYTTGGPPAETPLAEFYTTLTTEACKQITPAVVLLGQTDLGRDIAPRLAARLEAGVTMDCTGLDFDANSKMLLQTKPVYGGNAVAVWASEISRTQVVTMRPRSTAPAEPDASRKGEIINLSIPADKQAIKVRLVESIREENKGIKLEDAKVIVTGGGGIGGKEGFKLLEELATIIGGTVAVTRVPCDEGWKPISLEIGQTGHIVSPDLYIAVGVSGAPQHMAGCSGSKRIVAINRDSDAPIFKESDFGLVGDYKEALPVLIQKLKSMPR